MHNYIFIILIINVYFAIACAENEHNVTAAVLLSVDNQERSTDDTDDDTSDSFDYVLEEDYTFDLSANEGYLSTIPPPYQLIYPYQLRRGEEMIVDTRDYRLKGKITHYLHTTVVIHAFGQKYRIRLELNRELLSNGLKVKRSFDKETQIIEEVDTINCYYQGRIKRLPGSAVALSTCSGVRGIVSHENATWVIAPLKLFINENETRYPHVIYASVAQNNESSGSGHLKIESYETLHKREFLYHLKLGKSMKEAKKVEARHLRLALIVDNSLFQQLGGLENNVTQFVLQITNLVDLGFQASSVRVSLVHVEMWNIQDLFAVVPNVRQTLHNLLLYRLQGVRAVSPHAVILLTTRQFADGSVGLSLPDTICTDHAVGVAQIQVPVNLARSAAVLLHLIGRNLGISNPFQDVCSCNDPLSSVCTNFVGWAGKPYSVQLDTCSKERLANVTLAQLPACLLLTAQDNTYMQQCGDGIVQRGEECDCGSEQRCALNDPCCDHRTCLLVPWATCHSGECCRNCTLLSSVHVCRPAVSECDVAEMCDGLSSQCGRDERVRDGEPCAAGSGYCHSGKCPTHSANCRLLWGPGSTSADDKCYSKFNVGGHFNGHCGINTTSGLFNKCSAKDVRCGLLHCSGGSDKPLVGFEQAFTMTTVVADGNSYECKVVSVSSENMNSSVGLVADGVRCGDRHVCERGRCSPLPALTTSSPCPRDALGRTCSAHGVCTDSARCYCHAGYVGIDCSVRLPQTAVNIIALDTSPSTISTQSWIELITVSGIPASNIMVTLPSVTLGGDRSSSVMWLLGVLAGVVSGTLLLLLCCLLCYRRKNPVHWRRRSRPKTKSFMGSLSLMMSPLQNKYDDLTPADMANRLISFGNMPSYRADKLKKAMKMTGRLSETDSERSHSQRNSVDISQRDVPASLPVKDTPPLPLRAPEKGILKKQSSESTDSLQSGCRLVVKRVGKERQDSHATFIPAALCKQSSALDAALSSKVSSDSRSESISTVATVQSKDDRTIVAAHEKMLDEAEHVESDLDDILGADGITNASDSDNDENRAFLREDRLDARREKTPSTSITRDSSQTRMTELTSLSRSSSSVDEAKNRLVKLKNIDELLKQIDEHFSSVLQQTGDVRQSVYEPTLLTTPYAGDLAIEPETDRTYQLSSNSKSGSTRQHSPFSTLQLPGLQESRTRASSSGGSGAVSTPATFGATFTRSSTANSSANIGVHTVCTASSERLNLPFVVCAPLETYKTPLVTANSFGTSVKSSSDTTDGGAVMLGNASVTLSPELSLHQHDLSRSSSGRHKSPSRIPVAKARKSLSQPSSHCKLMFDGDQHASLEGDDVPLESQCAASSPTADAPSPCVPYRGVKSMMGSPPPAYKSIGASQLAMSPASSSAPSVGAIMVKTPPLVPAKPSRLQPDGRDVDDGVKGVRQ